ncbi:MAG: diaminopimelate decarboxylase [Chloroflexi bacterium]|nr:diaminopimelate decarboxylase [Chloroflexota bacterium]
MPDLDPALAPVLPRTAEVTPEGHLALGGCDAVDLAKEFGTPLYVFDEEELRATCRAYREAFASRYEQSAVVYAAKAYLGRWLAALVAEEGLGMDVVSGGELAVARSAGFPLERVLFHGSNKSAQELREAVDAGIGRIVIDNFHELGLLDDVAGGLGKRQPVLVRVSPNVDPHTHVKTTTGVLDTKFGFAIEGGQAEEAVVQALARSNLELLGLHCHLGSPIFELDPYRQANDVMIAFAARMGERHGLELREYSPGGGFAVQVLRGEPAPSPGDYAEAVVDSLRAALAREGLGEPSLTVEPGRAIVARAGVALYTVGARKELPGVRTYVSVDGGMADNIRPPMYDSQYAGIVANKPLDERRETITVAGKYCESGDILLKDADLPPLEPGDILALPASGAYNLPMASNYNAGLRPPVVLVRDGEAKLMRHRETYEDLTRADVWPLE